MLETVVIWGAAGALGFTALVGRLIAPARRAATIAVPVRDLPRPVATALDEIDDEGLVPAQRAMREAIATRKVWLSTEQIAERFLDTLRAEGWCTYPHLPADLDGEIVAFCDKHGIDRVSPQLVREVLATLPGVKRIRKRLNRHDPKHRFVIQRLAAIDRGHVDRCVLYYITARAPSAAHGPPKTRTGPTSGPAKGRAGRVGGRSIGPHEPGARPVDMQPTVADTPRYRTIGDVRKAAAA